MKTYHFLLCTLALLQKVYGQRDTITTTQFITDGDTIISSDGTFELGFFSPSDTLKNRYVGIWYKKISTTTPVWVANRIAPITNKSGVLKVVQPGVLVLLNDTNATIWSTNSSRHVKHPVAQLLNTGNLVVRDAEDPSPDNFLWQSFDYPSDSLLASMKLGRDLVTGFEWYLTSWRGNDDPAPGDYTYHCDPTGYPQDVMRKGPNVIYRSGPWNGVRWSGAPSMVNNTIASYGLIMNNREIYYKYELVSKSIVTTLVVKPSGNTMRMLWIQKTQGWINYHSVDADECDTYKLCGAHGICNILIDPVCQCLDKFEPKHPDDWNRADWSSGCVRKQSLNCTGDGFIKYAGVKLPDTRFSWFSQTMTLDECREVCLRNCSCMGYTNLDIRNGGSGCLLWLGELVDIRRLSESGLDIYIRMSASDIDSLDQSHRKKGKVLLWILPLSIGVILVILILLICSRRRKKALELKKKGRMGGSGNCAEEFEIPLFDLSTIAKATNNFSTDRKIGEGGFGPVYKGILDGQEIAVKRLSRTSTQGENEFKNEVVYIAKLQHRNLVKIVGCCIEGDEKMLIYEYLPNGSLDSFIFDEIQTRLLDWPKRFHIINGIARGLMYLHQDSQLRIIHRDLKANNILLDNHMNPKISDFGLAKICQEDDIGAKTNRVVGTYGYLSPEYAMHGQYSVKSDVFSFGILVLEILSGKSNRRFSHPDHKRNLLGHAWELYREGKSIDLLDQCLADTCSISEMVRSICIGLLCVQQCPEDRPNMSSVVVMLSNEGVLPQAKQPGFYIERNAPNRESSSSRHAQVTVSETPITELEAR